MYYRRPREGLMKKRQLTPAPVGQRLCRFPRFLKKTRGCSSRVFDKYSCVGLFLILFIRWHWENNLYWLPKDRMLNQQFTF